MCGLKARRFEDLWFRTLKRMIRVQRMPRVLVGKGKDFIHSCKRAEEKLRLNLSTCSEQ